MTTPPVVSIIMPAYNAAAFIQRAIEAVQAQTLSTWQLIIIDDASQDATATVARQYAAQDSRIIVHSMKTNGGPSVTRNKGLDLATGQWIAILDSDDSIDATRLARMVTIANQHTLDMLADNLWLYDADAHTTVRTLIPTQGEPLLPLTLDSFVRGDLPSSGSYLGWMKPLIRRDKLNELHLRYRPQYRHGEDFLLYAEALADGFKAAILRRPGYIYTTRTGEISRKVSSQSRTRISEDDLVTSSKWFEDTYADKMAPATRKAFAFRRKQCRLIPVFANFKSTLFKNPIASLLLLARNPGLIWFLIRTARRLPERISLRFTHKPEAVRNGTASA